MKKTALLILVSGLSLTGCTTIGQQITNKNGTIAINQPSGALPSEIQVEKDTQKVSAAIPAYPLPIPQKQVVPAPAAQTSAVQAPKTPVIQEYEYLSKRVIGSYIVIQ